MGGECVPAWRGVGWCDEGVQWSSGFARCLVWLAEDRTPVQKTSAKCVSDHFSKGLLFVLGPGSTTRPCSPFSSHDDLKSLKVCESRILYSIWQYLFVPFFLFHFTLWLKRLQLFCPHYMNHIESDWVWNENPTDVTMCTAPPWLLRFLLISSKINWIGTERHCPPQQQKEWTQAHLLLSSTSSSPTCWSCEASASTLSCSLQCAWPSLHTCTYVDKIMWTPSSLRVHDDQSSFPLTSGSSMMVIGRRLSHLGSRVLHHVHYYVIVWHSFFFASRKG